MSNYVVVAPTQLHLWALEVIKIKWGIRNPPPWLVCAMTGQEMRVTI